MTPRPHSSCACAASKSGSARSTSAIRAAASARHDLVPHRRRLRYADRRFVRGITMKRVMVFITATTDVAKVKLAFAKRGFEETEGYIVGYADDATIKELERHNIVNVVEGDPKPEKRFDSGGLGFSAVIGAGADAVGDPIPATASETELPEPPGYYLAWIQKPILPKYHTEL